MSYVTTFTKRCQQKFFIALISITYMSNLPSQMIYENVCIAEGRTGDCWKNG